MCGFVAIATARGKAANTALLHNLTRMLSHRGPDDEGYAWADPSTGLYKTWTSERLVQGDLTGILLGHRRLSILDLTANGHQPMLSDDGSIILVYNGEIYNFLELRRELEARNVRFHSQSDTEVLLRGYETWGVEVLNRLNGMWAFVLWDGREKKLVASRDRFGVKPLYYTEIDGTWILASEIKSLLSFPGVSRTVRDAGVKEFLIRGVTDHTIHSLFTDIHSVSPGGWIELTDGRLTSNRFWSMPEMGDSDGRSIDDLVEQYRYLLSDSVRLRMRSDVPTGTMLSGGLDSTAIASLICEHRDNEGPILGTAGAEGLRAFHHAFTACWPGSSMNEEARVEKLSSDFGLTLHKSFPTAESTLALLPKIASLLEEPFETPVAIVQYQLMEKAKEQGIKVVLNGHGSDEVIAGYPGTVVPVFLASLLTSGRFSTYRRERRMFRETGEWRSSRIALEIVRGMMSNRLRQWMDDNYRLMSSARLGIFEDLRYYRSAHDLELRSMGDHFSPLNKVLWRSFSQGLVPKWLRMEDRMSMAHSVESRLPFMDYRLIEFAFGLPDDAKLRDGYTKYILRRTMTGRLPDDLITDRRKQRFSTPYLEWFRGGWRPFIEDSFLGGGTCEVEPYLKLPRLREKLRAFLSGDNAVIDPSVLWRIINTEVWLKGLKNQTSLRP